MATLEMPQVSECSVLGCSYNDHSSCHAAAVTIGGSAAGEAQCATFIPLDVKGGLSKVMTFVGACQRADCQHNDKLECNAASVKVGPGAVDEKHADCLTYLAR
ncbi:DUF1540 domain-containing protein [Luteimicrobium subarcticum]|uniref:Uncharacterized protein DUF1540 n=1 Tax=Luteimicrobium subarcticum TaxID=620910 RepID=A0A2M8W6M7_9MICO|nr:DUF1540 domain-containing protein [Luteimicrobium subarcticum]PJI86585.1 uncharacterized protein DUF1540 [Luteimicrobium subarcticum]